MEKEELKKKAMEFLKSKVVAVIATSSDQNIPETATIYFIVDDEFNFYFHTQADSRKAQNFRKNPHVALVVGTENVPITVQVEGEVEQMHYGEELKKRYTELQQISHSGLFAPPLDTLKGEGLIIYKIKTTWLRFMDFREKSEERRNPVILIP